MKEHQLNSRQIEEYGLYLRSQEREQSTIDKYLHNVGEFRVWLGDRLLSKERMAEWKEMLSRSGQAPATVNGKISALNGFLTFMDQPECRVKPLRVQRRLFRDSSRELTREDYERLVQTAYTHNLQRLA